MDFLSSSSFGRWIIIRREMEGGFESILVGFPNLQQLRHITITITIRAPLYSRSFVGLLCLQCHLHKVLLIDNNGFREIEFPHQLVDMRHV